jgi:AmmeMemoRadiSam system protein B/AmmeMemoRadiSam system protein A
MAQTAMWRVRALSTLALIALVALPARAADGTRPSALAGSWYPGDAEALAAYVDAALDAAQPSGPVGAVLGLIAPHAGYRFSGATAAAAFAFVRGRSYKRVVLLAPAHRSPFRGLSIADAAAYETPLGQVPLDRDAVVGLRDSPLVSAHPLAHVREHAIEIELPMLQRALTPGWRLLPILVGRMEAEDYGTAVDLLRPLVDADTLLVVSSDFTHYGPRFGYLPFPLDERTSANIRALDEGALERVADLDAGGLLDFQARTGVTICGYRPLALLLELLPPGSEVRRVAYATSGELAGDYANSVSYVAVVVTSPGVAPQGRGATAPERGERTPNGFRLLHRLAVLAIEQAVRGSSPGRRAELERLVEALPPQLKEPSGAFVTLKRDGRLRGCIGTIGSSKPLYQAVLENGVNAAVNDRRFHPVAPQELEALEVEVSVLSPPAPIASPGQFRVGEHGIILEKDGRRAVFLPEVAVEQGWGREETLSHLARKAGLAPDAWANGARFEVFTSSRYAARVEPPD